MGDRPKRRRGKLGVRPTHGPIVQAVLDAQQEWLGAKKAGEDMAIIESQIAAGLKTVFGRGVHVSRCASCDDTGWVPVETSVYKCTVCGYWDRRWTQYCSDTGTDPSGGSDDARAIGRTRRTRR